MPDFKDYLT